MHYELAGLTTQTRQVQLTLGGTTRQDVEMRSETVTEEILVSGEAASALQTPTVGSAGSEDDRLAADAARHRRHRDSVPRSQYQHATRRPSHDRGGFAYDNVFLLNGVDINDNVFGKPDNLFIEDALEETQVLTSGVPASTVGSAAA